MGALRKHWPILLLFALFLALRIPALFQPLWYDEAGWGVETLQYASFPPPTNIIPHMPLAITLYKISTLAFGTSAWAFRLVPFLCGVAVFWLLYAFAKRDFGKTAATIAVGVYTVSAYALVANTQIDMDGSIVMLLITLALYFASGKRSARTDTLIGALLALLSLARFQAGFMALAIIIAYAGLQHWLRLRGKFIKRSRTAVLDTIKSEWRVGAAFVAFLSITVGILYVMAPAKILHVIAYGTGASGKSLVSFLLIGYALLFITPLLLIAPFLQLSRKYLLLYLWAFVYYASVFLYASGGDLPRYLMPALPALSILAGGVFASSLNWKKAKTPFVVGFFVAIAAFFLLNARLPFNPPWNVTELVHRITTGQWSFLFFYTSSSMHTTYVAFISIVLVFALAAIAVILWWLKRQWRGTALAIALSVLVAFNLFVAIDYDFGTTQPSVPRVQAEMLNVVPTNALVATDAPNYFTVMMNRPRERVVQLSPFNDFTRPRTTLASRLGEETVANRLVAQHIVLVMNHLGKPEADLAAPQGCALSQTFSDHNTAVGFLYICH